MRLGEVGRNGARRDAEYVHHGDVEPPLYQRRDDPEPDGVDGEPDDDLRALLLQSENITSPLINWSNWLAGTASRSFAASRPTMALEAACGRASQRPGVSGDQAGCGARRAIALCHADLPGFVPFSDMAIPSRGLAIRGALSFQQSDSLARGVFRDVRTGLRGRGRGRRYPALLSPILRRRCTS